MIPNINAFTFNEKRGTHWKYFTQEIGNMFIKQENYDKESETFIDTVKVLKNIRL